MPKPLRLRGEVLPPGVGKFKLAIRTPDGASMSSDGPMPDDSLFALWVAFKLLHGKEEQPLEPDSDDSPELAAYRAAVKNLVTTAKAYKAAL